jgi:hypothetical protein
MSPKKSTPHKAPVARKTTAKKASTPKGTAAKKPTSGAATKPDQMEPDVLEFIQAIDDYKRHESRPFPSWSEILEIVKGLGYERTVG